MSASIMKTAGGKVQKKLLEQDSTNLTNKQKQNRGNALSTLGKMSGDIPESKFNSNATGDNTTQDGSVISQIGQTYGSNPNSNLLSDVGSMTTNIEPMVGLEDQGVGAQAEANGPRGTDYASLTKKGGAMNTVNSFTQTPFAMKGNLFPLSQNQEKNE